MAFEGYEEQPHTDRCPYLRPRSTTLADLPWAYGSSSGKREPEGEPLGCGVLLAGPHLVLPQGAGGGGGGGGGGSRWDWTTGVCL